MEDTHLMVKKQQNNINLAVQMQGLEVSEKQIEIFARRLLPEIKKYFADENIQKEFEEWQRNQRDKKIE